MIRGLAHVCFNVADLDRSIDFYCNKLGFKHGFDFVKEGRRHGVYLHVSGRTFIELFQGIPDKPVGKPSYKHLCLEVTDMPGTVATLRQRGLEVSEPKVGMDQSWQAWLADPDGNRIEMHEYTPKSWQAPLLAEKK